MKELYIKKEGIIFQMDRHQEGGLVEIYNKAAH